MEHGQAKSRLDAVGAELERGLTLMEALAVLRRAARELTGADGVTIVLRDRDLCYYADEDAIGPLWKGRRFPIRDCVSGWAMLNRKRVVVPDIHQDPRIPLSAYEPTFVKALAMVPVRAEQPLAAIGAYWSTPHTATELELYVLETLAAIAARPLERMLGADTNLLAAIR